MTRTRISDNYEYLLDSTILLYYTLYYTILSYYRRRARKRKEKEKEKEKGERRKEEGERGKRRERGEREEGKEGGREGGRVSSFLWKGVLVVASSLFMIVLRVTTEQITNKSLLETLYSMFLQLFFVYCCESQRDNRQEEEGTLY